MRSQPANACAKTLPAGSTSNAGFGVSCSARRASASSTRISSCLRQGSLGWRPATSSKTRAIHSPSSWTLSKRGAATLCGRAAATIASRRCSPATPAFIVELIVFDERAATSACAHAIGAATGEAAWL